MLWRKSEGKSASDPGQGLSLWQEWNNRLQQIFQKHRVKVKDLPAFETVHQSWASAGNQSPEDFQKLIDASLHLTEKSRLAENQAIEQYIAGLRGILWSSLVQVIDQMTYANQEAENFQRIRGQMVKALDSDDLLQLKVAVKDWIVIQNQLDNARQKHVAEVQATFSKQLKELQAELIQTQTELKLDGLTQVYNRKAFDQEILKATQLSQLSGRPSTLLIFDIDHFKHVNDTYGHPIGDKVLQAFAKALVQHFPGLYDFVARYGGEEFAVIAGGCEPQEAIAKAERFIAALRSTKLEFGSVTLRITVSIGISKHAAFERPEEWIKRADQLLYKAKEDGRDCYMTDAPAA